MYPPILMAKPRPKAGGYLATLREGAKLRPAEVLAKLRARGLRVSAPNLTRWEKGQRGCPVAMQWQLAQIYGVAFMEMLVNTEGLPAEALASITKKLHGKQSDSARNEQAATLPSAKVEDMFGHTKTDDRWLAILLISSLPIGESTGLRHDLEVFLQSRRGHRAPQSREGSP